MRNYVKPESEVIALNMSENIAASANPKEEIFSSKTQVISDPTGMYVSKSEILWDTFITATKGFNNINVGAWLSWALGGMGDAYNALREKCIKDLD